MQYRSVTVLAPAKLNLSLDVVGTHIPAGLGQAVTGALVVGGQGSAQTSGGLAQAHGQPVQAVRVQPRHDADGILPRLHGSHSINTNFINKG